MVKTCVSLHRCAEARVLHTQARHAAGARRDGGKLISFHHALSSPPCSIRSLNQRFVEASGSCPLRSTASSPSRSLILASLFDCSLFSGDCVHSVLRVSGRQWRFNRCRRRRRYIFITLRRRDFLLLFRANRSCLLSPHARLELLWRYFFFASIF